MTSKEPEYRLMRFRGVEVQLYFGSTSIRKINLTRKTVLYVYTLIFKHCNTSIYVIILDSNYIPVTT